MRSVADSSESLRASAESVKVAFDAELWLRGARRTQGWTFVGPPASQSEEIRDLAGPVSWSDAHVA